MRKVMSLFGSLVLLLALGSGVAVAGEKNVLICHYPGHLISLGGIDYPDASIFQPSDATRCEGNGGHVISVSSNGAVNGHGIVLIPV
jgi:hypothetical protein